MTVSWKTVEQYFTVVMFALQFYSVCNFGKFINFGLRAVRSEKGKATRAVVNRQIIDLRVSFKSDGF